MSKQQQFARNGGHWLSQRSGSDNWCRTWFDKHTRQTKRASLGTTDFRQAELKLAEWIVNNQVLRKERPQEILVETVLLRYYEGHAKNIRSAEASRFAMAKWSTFFAEQVVSDINPTSIDGFIDSLRSQGCSEGYIGRILGVGKAALNRAYKLGEIASVPYVKSGSKGRTRERILSITETAQLFDAVESDHMLMYLIIAFNTLARPEAILQLKRFQIDLNNRLVTLNPHGREQTKKRRPTLPITDTLFPWLEQAKTDVLVCWRGKPIKAVRKGFKLIRERAGLDSSVTPYTIRHTMATELRRRGVQEWELAGFLGHSSGSVTERYAKFAPDYMSNARIAIDDYFIELQPHVKRTLVFNKSQRVNRVLVGDKSND